MLRSFVNSFRFMWAFSCVLHSGQPLADGWCACLFLCIGDLEYMRDCFGLENYNSATPCFLCACNSTSIPWTECGMGAQWWGHVHHDAVAWARGRTLNKLFATVGLSAFNCFPDVMHCKHLGIDQHLYASVLVMIANGAGDGGDAWAYVWEQLRAKYEVLGVAKVIFKCSFCDSQPSDLSCWPHDLMGWQRHFRACAAGPRHHESSRPHQGIYGDEPWRRFPEIEDQGGRDETHWGTNPADVERFVRWF